MISDKILLSKFYDYKGCIHKVKKIAKKKNLVIIENVKNGELVEIPLLGGEILVSRLYTIGEVAKIVEKRPDTIRKYERSGLLGKPSGVFINPGGAYDNWRFYKASDVYEVVDFFSDRSPGRPVAERRPSKVEVNNRIKILNQKTKTLGVK